MATIQINNLTVRYGHTLALDSVNAALSTGAVTGLIGPNGGGKSSLINAIAGSAPVTAGSVGFDAKPLDRQRVRIAYVPQAREVSWDFPLSAFDVVLMGRYRETGWMRRISQRDRDLAEHALEAVDLAGMGDRHISQFSGGQQQRIFFARALVQDPEIVLLDEPLAGIDVATRERINALITGFAKRGALVLLATHDLEDAREICDYVLCLNRQMVAFGPTEETFTPETMRATFGGQLAIFT